MAGETASGLAGSEAEDDGADESLGPPRAVSVEAGSFERGDDGVACGLGRRCGGRSLQQEREDVGVAAGDGASPTPDFTESIVPRQAGCGRRQLAEQRFDDQVEQVGLVVHVPVQRHRRHAEAIGDCLHGEAVEPLVVGDRKARLDDR